jgi:hypothetical protein
MNCEVCGSEGIAVFPRNCGEPQYISIYIADFPAEILTQAFANMKQDSFPSLTYRVMWAL